MQLDREENPLGKQIRDESLHQNEELFLLIRVENLRLRKW